MSHSITDLYLFLHECLTLPISWLLMCNHLMVSIFYICSFANNFSDSSFDYNKLEEKLEAQTRIYLDKYYDDALTSDKVKITRNVLRVYDLDVILMDDKGRECSGYSVAYKSKAVVNVKAYISCKKYVTEGYDEYEK